MFDKLTNIFKIPELRNRFIFMMLLILVFQLLANITVPGVNKDALDIALEGQAGLQFFSSLMGGGLMQFSVILMGLSPYINAVIIIQLLGVIIPKIGNLQKEGESGQKKINSYTRWLSLPLAVVQSYGMIFLMNSLAGGIPVIDTTDISTVLFAMLITTTGTMFLVWLGEIMTEYGIGNGTSMIITAGVLSAVPAQISFYTGGEKWGLFAFVILLTLAVIFILIRFTEGHRRIPIIYSRTGREEKSYFPIRVNQAGMVPIIFAISIITLPSIIGQILTNNATPRIQDIGNFLVANFSMTNPEYPMIFVYFMLVLLFSFFYVSITFNTEQISENIQKRGGYIPGIRPGNDTSEYLGKVSNRLNLFGGGFLALVAISPYVMQNIFNEGPQMDLIINAAGLIIIVSVILDLLRKVESEVKMHDYSKYE